MCVFVCVVCVFVCLFVGEWVAVVCLFPAQNVLLSQDLAWELFHQLQHVSLDM